MTEKEVQDLIDLSDKIDDGSASVEEYMRFKSILLTHNVNEEDIARAFKKSGFYSWEDYLRKKQDPHMTFLSEEAKLLGTLLGYFMYVLFMSNHSKKMEGEINGKNL